MRAYGVALDGGADITLPNKTKVDEARPSIAVLPFENMSGDAEQAYFSDGITEDLITSLSKIDGLFVIARNSTFTYKEQRKPSMKSPLISASATFSKEASAKRVGAFALPHSSSTDKPAVTCGPIAMIVISPMFSLCRTKSPNRSSMRSRSS